MAAGQMARWVWRCAARLDVAAGIILIVVLGAALGSWLPQLAPTIADNPERLAAWMDGLHVRYPSLADFFLRSGAVQFFRTPLFLTPWAALLLVSLLCTLNRWRGVWRAIFRTEVRCADTTLAAAPYTAVLEMPPGAALVDRLRGVLERQGFRVRTETVPLQKQGTTADSALFLRADRNRLAPLGTLVTHVAVFLLLLGALLSIQFSWREELTVAPGQAVAVGHGTDLTVSNAGFAILYYPDGNIAAYEAEIGVGLRGEVHARSRVNAPFVYRGVGFYLRGYATGEGGTTLTLLAAYDPGYSVVIAAGFLLFFAMTVTITFPARRVRGCTAVDGTLHLGGWAERQAYGFEREFAALVAEVRGTTANKPGGWAC